MFSNELFNYEHSDYHKSLWKNHISYEKKAPHIKNVQTYSWHPVLSITQDETIQDAGLCRTSINNKLDLEVQT